MYFFQATLPASVVLANHVNFLVGLGLLLVVLLLIGVNFWGSIWLLPVPLLALLLLSLGLALLTSVANLYYRDTQYLVGLFTMAWFYATPIIYPLSFVERVGEPWLTLYRLNPATALIETFRAILYDGRLGGAQACSGRSGRPAIVLAVGWLVFRAPNRASPRSVGERLDRRGGRVQEVPAVPRAAAQPQGGRDPPPQADLRRVLEPCATSPSRSPRARPSA